MANPLLESDIKYTLVTGSVLHCRVKAPPVQHQSVALAIRTSRPAAIDGGNLHLKTLRRRRKVVWCAVIPGGGGSGMGVKLLRTHCINPVCRCLEMSSLLPGVATNPSNTVVHGRCVLTDAI